MEKGDGIFQEQSGLFPVRLWKRKYWQWSAVPRPTTGEVLILSN